jgi:hypothetical protein
VWHGNFDQKSAANEDTSADFAAACGSGFRIGLVALQKGATSGAIPHACRAEASAPGAYGSRQTFF